MSESERMHNLSSLIHDLLKKEDVNFANRGCGRGILDSKPLDCEIYDLFQNENQIGHFEFELKNGFYACELDLNLLSADKYKSIVDSIKREFPEVNF